MPILIPVLLSFAAAGAGLAFIDFNDLNPFKDECGDNQYRWNGLCLPKGSVFGLGTVPTFDQIVPEALHPLVKAMGVVPAVVPLADAFLATAATPDKMIQVLSQATGETISVLEEAGKSQLTTVQKGVNDAAAAYEKGWRDTSAQARRSFSDAVDAGAAVARYVERQLESSAAAGAHALDRARQGRIVDAMWGLATEQLQGAEENFAKASQESELIAAAAQSAAATYGGPAGAAAYAAWATYRNTGDADLALRAGPWRPCTARPARQRYRPPTASYARPR